MSKETLEAVKASMEIMKEAFTRQGSVVDTRIYTDAAYLMDLLIEQLNTFIESNTTREKALVDALEAIRSTTGEQMDLGNNCSAIQACYIEAKTTLDDIEQVLSQHKENG